MLYAVFLVTVVLATAMGLLMIWGGEPNIVFGRVLGTCVVLAVASALTMSASRLIHGGLPEDADG